MIPRLLALCLLSLAGSGEPPTAQDGAPGFGAQPSTEDLRQVFGAREGSAAEFLAALAELEPDLRRQVRDLRDHCAERGFGALLPAPRSGEFELRDLHAAFEQALLRPEPLLAAGDDRARALGEMLLDERFRARVRVLAGWEAQAQELRRGLAVFAATTEGYVVLSDRERGLLGPRVDLAASSLRALGNDLSVLAPQVVDQPARRARQAAVDELLAASPAELHGHLGRAARTAERMSSLLFSARLAAQVNVIEARAIRTAALSRAQALRRAALQYLPETPAGQAAPPEIAELRKHERLRLAGAAGQAGLNLDPLDEVCAFAAGRGEDFAWGPQRSRPLFDRYLALRGIRSHDHRTLAGRQLTDWEQQALGAVTAGL